MAKKSSSGGGPRNISGNIRSGMKQNRHPAQKIINTQQAWLKGQNPWVTIENPNKEQLGKRYIRVRSNDIWGHPKERAKKMFVIPGA